MLLHSRIEGEGKPLLIIHGFLGMSDNWKSFGTLYAAEGFQVHMLDLRNHGKSFHSDEFSYEIMVEDVKQYCEFLNRIYILFKKRHIEKLIKFAMVQIRISI